MVCVASILVWKRYLTKPTRPVRKLPFARRPSPVTEHDKAQTILSVQIGGRKCNMQMACFFFPRRT